MLLPDPLKKSEPRLGANMFQDRCFNQQPLLPWMVWFFLQLHCLLSKGGKLIAAVTNEGAGLANVVISEHKVYAWIEPHI